MVGTLEGLCIPGRRYQPLNAPAPAAGDLGRLLIQGPESIR